MYTPPAANMPSATIRSYTNNKILRSSEEARIVSIDKKDVSYLAADLVGTSVASKKIAVAPGPHVFDISTTFKRGVFSGVQEAFSEVDATLLAGVDYRVQEAIDTVSGHVKVWVVDNKGKVISPIVMEPYHQQAVQMIYAPMIVK